MSGGTGNDTYFYRLGDGNDVIDNTTAGTSDIDALKFTTGITTEQVFFKQQGNDLIIDFLDSQDETLVQRAFVAAAYQIDHVYSSECP